MKMLKHITQPDGNTCVQTCWAMLAGMDVGAVIDIAGSHPLSFAGELQLAQILGLQFNIFMLPRLMPGNYHIVTVPSLNYVGGNHRIILYCSGEPGKDLVIDPNEGRDGMEVYNVENLKSYSEVWMVHPHKDLI